MLRSRSYLGLLVPAATIGLPVSAVADGFLALVSYLQEIFTHLHHGPPWARSSPRRHHAGRVPEGGDDVGQAGYRKRAGYLKQAAVRR